MSEVSPHGHTARTAPLCRLVAQHERADDDLAVQADPAPDRAVICSTGRQVSDVVIGVLVAFKGSLRVSVPVGNTRYPGVFTFPGIPERRHLGTHDATPSKRM